MNYKKERPWNKIRKTIHEEMRDVTKVKIIKKKKTRTLKNTMNKLKSTIESVNKKNGSEEEI